MEYRKIIEMLCYIIDKYHGVTFNIIATSMTLRYLLDYFTFF